MPGEYAVWQLPPDLPLPPMNPMDFLSITRTADELSIVSPVDAVPAGARAETGWRCLGVVGPLSFELTGILADLSAPLARSGIPIFVISTYDTDYLLVHASDLDRARAALEADGHVVEMGEE
jgi:hypothetical protein